jgi:hypothetical protein
MLLGAGAGGGVGDGDGGTPLFCAIIISFTIKDGNGTALAFSSFLKLPAAGRKNLKRLIVFLWTSHGIIYLLTFQI